MDLLLQPQRGLGAVSEFHSLELVGNWEGGGGRGPTLTLTRRGLKKSVNSRTAIDYHHGRKWQNPSQSYLAREADGGYHCQGEKQADTRGYLF